MNTDTRAEVAAALRRWAEGVYPTEAAAELIIRAWNGRLLAGPWIRTGASGWVWFDGTRIAEAGYLSGGERRVLAIACSLVCGEETAVSLNDVLPGLDRDALALVLAAIAHAGGSHEHSEIRFENNAYAGTHRLAPLYPWPADDVEET